MDSIYESGRTGAESMRAVRKRSRAARIRLKRIAHAVIFTAGEAIRKRLHRAGYIYNGIRHRSAAGMSRMGIPRMASVLFLAAAALLVISGSIVGVGLQVYVDGTSMGFVSNQSDFENLLTDVENMASEVLGYPYTLDVDVKYQFEMYDRREGLDELEVKHELLMGIDEIEQLYVVSVDGETVGANTDGTAVKSLVDSFLTRERTIDENVRVEFVRNVEVSLEYTDAQNFATISELAKTLSSNIRDEETYTVQEGDTLSAIAAAHGMSLATLQGLNPGVEEIAVGDTVVVNEAIPLMSVQKVSREVYTEGIAHQTEYIYDDTIDEGKRVTSVAGVDGEKQITADVTYVDGKETDREILLEEVLSEPVTEVIKIGTRKKGVATGTYIIPFNGARTYRGSYDFHTGIDFAGASGSAIVASDGGTVSWAGWKGNYGYLVIIDHGDGVQTYYAHCSKLLVTEGELVSQGDTIARVGSTGRSTGPHCHFEVRIDGTAVNPAIYLW